MGFVALILTITLNCIALSGLRTFTAGAEEALWLLAAGYAPMTLLALRRQAAVDAGNVTARGNLLWVAIWAASVIIIYCVFLLYPGSISISHVIIAQSITPVLAVFLTGNYRFHGGGGESLFRLLPLGTLMVLAAMRSESGSGHATLWGFSVLCLAFLGAQTAMRRLARASHPGWAIPRFAFCSLVLISIVVLAITGGQVNMPGSHLTPLLLAAGLVVPAVQFGYLFGMTHTRPLLSALAISMAVPIARAVEWGWYDVPVSGLEALLAGVYCTLTVGSAALDLRSNTTTVPDTPRAEDTIKPPQDQAA